MYRGDHQISLPGYGSFKLDVNYGGAYYAMVDVNQVKMDISSTPIAGIFVKYIFFSS